MSRLTRTAPVRWCLTLLVRLLRSPAVRRRLLPLLFGQTVDARGRVRHEEWRVPAPALGDRCVPGCTDPLVDWDGAHYCRVEIGYVDHVRDWLAPVSKTDDPGFVVEVTQVQRENGRLEPRKVWLLEVNPDGTYAGDGLELTPAGAARLGALLDTAFVVAGQFAPARDQHAGGAR
jgi:hypothetical protein